MSKTTTEATLASFDNNSFEDGSGLRLGAQVVAAAAARGNGGGGGSGAVRGALRSAPADGRHHDQEVMTAAAVTTGDELRWRGDNIQSINYSLVSPALLLQRDSRVEYDPPGLLKSKKDTSTSRVPDSSSGSRQQRPKSSDGNNKTKEEKVYGNPLRMAPFSSSTGAAGVSSSFNKKNTLAASNIYYPSSAAAQPGGSKQRGPNSSKQTSRGLNSAATLNRQGQDAENKLALMYSDDVLEYLDQAIAR